MSDKEKIVIREPLNYKETVAIGKNAGNRLCKTYHCKNGHMCCLLDNQEKKCKECGEDVEILTEESLWRGCSPADHPYLAMKAKKSRNLKVIVFGSVLFLLFYFIFV